MKKLLVLGLAVAGLSTVALNANRCGSCETAAPSCVKMVEKHCPAKKVCETNCHWTCPDGTKMAKDVQPQNGKKKTKRSAEY